MATTANWRKSTFSGSAGECVEVSVQNAVALRDSKNPDGPCLLFTLGEWAAFLAGARDDQFDVQGAAFVR
jgi:hypothetical protein